MLIKAGSYRLGGHVVHLVESAMIILTLACLTNPSLSALFASLALMLFVIDRLYLAPKIQRLVDEFVPRLQHSLLSDDLQTVRALIRQYAWIRFFGRQTIVFKALGEALLAQGQYENAILHFRKVTFNGNRALRLDACFGILKAAKARGDEEMIETYLGILRRHGTSDLLVNARLERFEKEEGL